MPPVWTAIDIADMFADCGYDIREYSGRGMFGTYCLGIVIPREISEAGVIAEVMITLAESCPPDYDTVIAYQQQLAAVLHAARRDNLGLDTILYFPQLKITPGDLAGYA